jgi:hypothetical protein
MIGVLSARVPLSTRVQKVVCCAKGDTFTNVADSSAPLTQPELYANKLNPRLKGYLTQGDGRNDIDPAKTRFSVVIVDFMYFNGCLKIFSKNWQQDVIRSEWNREWQGNSGTPIAHWPNVPDDKKVWIYFQDDGSLVVYGKDRAILWGAGYTNTNGKPHEKKLKFQSDGHLVIYDNGKPVWKADPFRNDCRLRLMSGPPYIMIDTEQEGGRTVWCTAIRWLD